MRILCLFSNETGDWDLWVKIDYDEIQQILTPREIGGQIER